MVAIFRKQLIGFRHFIKRNVIANLLFESRYGKCFNCCVVSVYYHYAKAAKKLMYKITGGSSNGIVLYIRFFKEVTEFGRSVSYTYFLAELLSDFIHAFGLHPAHGSALATLPLYFAGRQKKMVSFFKIMIF